MNDLDRRLMVGRMSRLGFRESMGGTRYLRAAIEMYEPGMFLTKELYPGLAKMFGTTTIAVERAMRTAVKDAAERCADEDRRQYFGSADPDCAKVSEFIKAMKVYLEFGI